MAQAEGEQVPDPRHLDLVGHAHPAQLPAPEEVERGARLHRARRLCVRASRVAHEGCGTSRPLPAVRVGSLRFLHSETPQRPGQARPCPSRPARSRGRIAAARRARPGIGLALLRSPFRATQAGLGVTPHPDGDHSLAGRKPGQRRSPRAAARASGCRVWKSCSRTLGFRVGTATGAGRICFCPGGVCGPILTSALDSVLRRSREG